MGTGSLNHTATSNRQKLKDPAKQASESKRVLFDFIRRNTDVQLNGSFGHMVVFPGHIQTNDMAPHLPRRIICDALDLSTLSTKLEDLTKYWNQKHQLSQDDVVTLVDALIPTFRLVGTDRVHIDEVERGLDKLTRTQLEIWSMLGRVDRLVVTGGAGTGKTLLAHNQAIQLSNRGYKVLFCVPPRAWHKPREFSSANVLQRSVTTCA